MHFFKIIFTAFYRRPDIAKYQLIFCILSNVMSIYLAYLLYVLENICVVCISIYVVNILCLWEILKDFNKLRLQNYKITTKTTTPTSADAIKNESHKKE